jgi:hypothetical protein
VLLVQEPVAVAVCAGLTLPGLAVAGPGRYSCSCGAARGGRPRQRQHGACATGGAARCACHQPGPGSSPSSSSSSSSSGQRRGGHHQVAGTRGCGPQGSCSAGALQVGTSRPPGQQQLRESRRQINSQ